LTCSPREIADSETPHWSDNLRTDHFSNARAARSCAPLIGGLEFRFPATRLFLDGSYLRPEPNSNSLPSSPSRSRTTKQASNSSTDQGGGKRGAAPPLCAR
jgi:hypothetical protein